MWRVWEKHAQCNWVARLWARLHGGWQEGLIVQRQSSVSGEPSITPGATVASVHAHNKASHREPPEHGLGCAGTTETPVVPADGVGFRGPDKEQTIQRIQMKDGSTRLAGRGGMITGINCVQILIYEWWRAANRDREEEKEGGEWTKRKEVSDRCYSVAFTLLCWHDCFMAAAQNVTLSRLWHTQLTWKFL